MQLALINYKIITNSEEDNEVNEILLAHHLLPQAHSLVHNFCINGITALYPFANVESSRLAFSMQSHTPHMFHNFSIKMCELAPFRNVLPQLHV